MQRPLSRDVLGHVQGTAEVKCEWSGVSKGNSVEHEVREVEGSICWIEQKFFSDSSLRRHQNKEHCETRTLPKQEKRHKTSL